MKPLNEEQRTRYHSAIRQGFINPDNPMMHSFCGTWVKKHPERVTTLVRLKDILGHNPEWEDMTDDTLSDLKDDMLSEMSPNSVRTICAELKAVLNHNKATKPIKSATFNVILRSKKVPVQNVFLTPTELKHLHLYEPMGELEAYAKEIFMRECLTGARVVDCRRFTTANIHTEDGVEYLTYVAQKHPIEVTVPVHKWLGDYLHTDWSSRMLKMREDNLNEPIRTICRNIGMTDEVTCYKKGMSMTGEKWRFVATHTGRRTFATILSLKGCPLEQIAIMMGHVNGNVPNISMTAGYICAKKKINKSVLALFN